jgi:hypothetical protein
MLHTVYTPRAPAWGMIEMRHVSGATFMQTDTHPMFAKHLTNAGHTHRFLIVHAGPSGWEVREEHDSQVVRRARYTDWHRVERARQMFSLRASRLTDDGWVEK